LPWLSEKEKPASRCSPRTARSPWPSPHRRSGRPKQAPTRTRPRPEAPPRRQLI
jgi:hypothetical protein